MLVRNFEELSRPVRLAKADAAAKRASFTLPPTDKTDMAGELRRQEMRAYVRSLPLEDRMNAVEKLDDTAILAILDAPAMLSGLPEDRHAHIKNAYLEHQFGKQLRELESVDEDNTALEAAAVMVRRDLQMGAGLTNAEFEVLKREHE